MLTSNRTKITTHPGRVAGAPTVPDSFASQLPMLKPRIMRRSALGALLALCFLSSPLMAAGLGNHGGNQNHRFKNYSWKRTFSWDRQITQKEVRNDAPAVPEPSSILAALAAGGGLCGLTLYRRRSRS